MYKCFFSHHQTLNTAAGIKPGEDAAVPSCSHLYRFTDSYETLDPFSRSAVVSINSPIVFSVITYFRGATREGDGIQTRLDRTNPEGLEGLSGWLKTGHFVLVLYTRATPRWCSKTGTTGTQGNLKLNFRHTAK